MKINQVAGGVVINDDGQVLVVSQHGDSWSLPKGHIDPGETTIEAAMREIREESGITNMKLIKELGTYERYRIGKDGRGEDKTDLKQITIFLFTTDQQELKPEDQTHPEAQWLEPKAAIEKLTHPKDKEFLNQNLSEVV